MKQYLITGYDHTDEGALERRMAVRPHHLDGSNELRDNGNYIMGGAILNDEGKMIGSVMVLQFETDEAAGSLENAGNLRNTGHLGNG